MDPPIQTLLEHRELKFRKNYSGHFKFAKGRNESFLHNILVKFSSRAFMVRENVIIRPFFIPRLDECEGNGNELYFRDVTVVWTNLRSVGHFFALVGLGFDSFFLSLFLLLLSRNLTPLEAWAVGARLGNLSVFILIRFETTAHTFNTAQSHNPDGYLCILSIPNLTPILLWNRKGPKKPVRGLTGNTAAITGYFT